MKETAKPQPCLRLKFVDSLTLLQQPSVTRSPMAMTKEERLERFQAAKSLTGGTTRRTKHFQLAAYTISTMVFGMICSALGPAIPWLAGNAQVSPEVLGWLPAAQAVMCIASGLASSLMAYVPRRFHHRLLFAMMLWLGGFFALLPVASQTMLALVATYGFQVLPRPWIGQMTNLLVSELYEDASLSSAAQSFNQGGFAFGCVIMVLLEQLSSSTFGTQGMFYMAGGFTALSSLLFLKLPVLEDRDRADRDAPKASRASSLPSCFTLTCSGLGVLAVGLEVACGTWLITSMTQMGFSTGAAAAANITFWILFAFSRLALAPCICKCLRPRPAAMVVGGAAVASVSCLPAAVWPNNLPAIFFAVSGVAMGAGPTYAMCISMAKERRALTSVDSAMFAIASSLGAGGVPFVMSRILALLGAASFFPTLLCMCLVLLSSAYLIDRISCHRAAGEQDEEDVEKGCTKTTKMAEIEQPAVPATPVVPPIVWTFWEQGWQDAPALCQACASSWELANPDLSIRKISAAELPELLPELCRWQRLWELPPQQRADLVRLALLEKFGGIWADATLFCAAPVMPWLQALESRRPQGDQGAGSAAKANPDFFFVFDRSDSNTWVHDPFVKRGLLISNWFLASTPGHPLVSQWLAAMHQEVAKTTIAYFGMHNVFRTLLEDEANRRLYDQVPRVSARHPHLLEFELGFSTSATGAARELLRQSLEIAPMQKLSHKILQENFLVSLCRCSASVPSLLGDLFARHDGVMSKLCQRQVPSNESTATHQDLRLREQENKRKVLASWKTFMYVPTACPACQGEEATAPGPL